MIRGSVVALFCAMAACGKPSVSAHVDPEPTAAPQAAITEADAARFYDAWAKQFEADARAGITKTFASSDEASRYVEGLTPANFHPRAQFFAAIVDGGDSTDLVVRMNSFIHAHPEIADRELDRVMPIIEAASNDLLTSIATRFPQEAPSRTP